MQYPKFRGALTSAFCLVATVAPAAAAPIVYTDRAAFIAATTGHAVSDFSGLGSGSGYGQSYAGTNWTLSTSTALLISYDSDNMFDYQFYSGRVLSLARLSETAGIFTPASGVTAFGFDFGVRTSDANSRVTINNVDYNATGAPTWSFFGIVDSAGVSPIALSFAVGRGIFDNVTVASALPAASAVPEPATWGMMLVGFGAIGLGLRRRQRTSVRFA